MTSTELFTHIEQDHLHALEETAFVAWPAEEVAALDGWRLRATAGVTNRANSVWSQASSGEVSLDKRIDDVENFYRVRSLPSRFQVNAGCVPDGLVEALESRGYVADSPTIVEVAPLEIILRQTSPLRSTPHLEIEICEEFESSWFELYEANEGENPAFASVRAGILRRITAQSAYVRADVDGVPAAVALGVLSAGNLCVSNVSTAPQWRRRGAAAAILRALAIWAQMQGGTEAFLQVKATNVPALALYARAGFETAYNYHYRTLQLAASR